MMVEIVSRAEAKAKGLKRYFTGRKCSRGHVSERLVHGECIACVETPGYRDGKLAYMRAYNARNAADADYRSQMRERGRARYVRMPRKFVDCVVCQSSISECADSKTSVCSPTCRRSLSNQNRKAWIAANPLKAKASRQRYSKKNAAKLAEKNRRWHLKNRERKNALHRAWLEKNRDTVNARQRVIRLANPEKYRAYARAYYELNREKKMREAMEYRLRNPDAVKRQIARQKERALFMRAAALALEILERGQ